MSLKDQYLMFSEINACKNNELLLTVERNLITNYYICIVC